LNRFESGFQSEANGMAISLQMHVYNAIFIKKRTSSPMKRGEYILVRLFTYFIYENTRFESGVCISWDNTLLKFMASLGPLKSLFSLRADFVNKLIFQLAGHLIHLVLRKQN
jgi:hypothetical protein